ncbi:MAG: hypothetical protein AABY22_03310 [Nanoarchaeota archaeon]
MNWKGGISLNKKKYKHQKYLIYKPKQDTRRIELYKERKRQIFEYYGGIPPICKCCNEILYEFLTLDHINGGGRKERNQFKNSYTKFMLWIIKNNFPKGYQILCFNCNQAKGIYGKCPHTWTFGIKENEYNLIKEA